MSFNHSGQHLMCIGDDDVRAFSLSLFFSLSLSLFLSLSLSFPLSLPSRAHSPPPLCLSRLLSRSSISLARTRALSLSPFLSVPHSLSLSHSLSHSLPLSLSFALAPPSPHPQTVSPQLSRNLPPFPNHALDNKGIS